MNAGVKGSDCMRDCYLDNAATNICVVNWIDDRWMERSNPSSTHKPGRSAKLEVDTAKEKIMNMIGANAGDIIFTSGGTESNNLAIMGLKKHLIEIGKKHIVSSSIEHPSVYKCCEALAEDGFKYKQLDVFSDGVVFTHKLENYLANRVKSDPVGLVSVQMVNSEIGTLQPIKEIGEICKRYDVLFHVDAVQGLGFYPIEVDDWNVDFLSISGHKLGADKGIGALYVRDRSLLSPIIYGGGQQFGLRSGTENMDGILSLSEAITIYMGKQKKVIDCVSQYYDDLLNGFKSTYNGVWSTNGMRGHVLSLTIPGVEGSALMMMLDAKGIYISTGSACHSNSLEPSHVLKEIGLLDKDALCTIRLSLSMYNSFDDLVEVGKIIGETANQLYEVGRG